MYTDISISNLVIWHLVFNIQEYARPCISLIKLRKTLVTRSLRRSNQFINCPESHVVIRETQWLMELVLKG